MNLLCERQQSTAVFNLVPLRFGGGVMFTLWAKVELDPEEQELLYKYRFDDAQLIADDWVATLRRSLRVSLLVGFLLWIVLFAFLSWSWATLLTFIAVALITGLYYNELRGNIYVRDLIHGRKFRCFSIIELIRKEHYLQGISMYLRQVLESAKHWDGQEAIVIPPLTPELAKLLVVEGGSVRNLVFEAMMMGTEGASNGYREGPPGPASGWPRSEGRFQQGRTG